MMHRAQSRAGTHTTHDFITLERPDEQAVVLIFGDAGAGKTTFSTRYAPSPNAFINLDGRAKWAVLEAQEKHDKIIHFLKISCPTRLTGVDQGLVLKKARRVQDLFFRNFEWALEESLRGNVRTITVDTVTELERMLILVARGGRLKPLKRDYGASQGQVNVEINNIFDMSREGKAHLLLLARAKQLWENQEPVNKFEPRCGSAFKDGVDWSGLIRNKKTIDGVEWSLQVRKSGVRIREMTEVYSSRDWGKRGPFSYACRKQYPRLSKNVWK